MGVMSGTDPQRDLEHPEEPEEGDQEPDEDPAALVPDDGWVDV